MAIAIAEAEAEAEANKAKRNSYYKQIFTISQKPQPQPYSPVMLKYL